VSLSDRKPSIDGTIEAVWSSWLYASVQVATVRLPSQPAAEVTFEGGIRKEIADTNLELGLSYLAYPGEAQPNGGINYWEASVSAQRCFGAIGLSAEYAYAPNFANTGAWGQYAELGLSYDLPGSIIREDLKVSLSAALGYAWFGNQSATLGGFPLPSYLNWNAGIAFTYRQFTLDLRYYDTNLTREDCFVTTNDFNAVPGGLSNPISNTGGLTSRWCGAAFVGKLSVTTGQD